jgi:hypothetical protein
MSGFIAVNAGMRSRSYICRNCRTYYYLFASLWEARRWPDESTWECESCKTLAQIESAPSPSHAAEKEG